MDEGSFDNLVRGLATAMPSRRALVSAAAIFGLSLLAPLSSESEAARRRRGGRRKGAKPGNGKQGSSGKGSGGGKKPHGGKPDCGDANRCFIDPETGKPGFLCADGQCSCGGTCCQKGYACFVEKSTPGREVCCYIDSNNTEPPEDAKLISCPGEFFDSNICCEREHCNADGTCSFLTLGRYRRTPR